MSGELPGGGHRFRSKPARRMLTKRGRSRSRSLALATTGVFAMALAAVVPLARRAPSPVDACAFAKTPNTYETTEDRQLYLQAIDLAGYDMLFPNDTFFSQRTIDVGTRQNRSNSDDVYVPPALLKSIAWLESLIAQGASGVPFGSIGPALVSFDCGHGIGQVTSGMTEPLGEGGQASDEQALVATHFAYNIGRSAAILIDKWNSAPENRPIAGIDTNSDPSIVENWYFAVWGYNGFTGPGANRSNHPMDPIYPAWPRVPYSCGPSNDGRSHNRSLFPYQELVYGCMAHPPIVKGDELWEPIDATLPDLNNPYWRTPLELSKFQAPYSGMDIPTPKPQHADPTDRPSAADRAHVLGSPKMSIDRPILLVNVRPGQSATPADVRISNTGTGVLAWRASANKSWVSFSSDAGVAVGSDLTCISNAPCERTAVLHISVDPKRVLGSDAAVVRIEALGQDGSTQELALFIKVNVALGVPGTSKN